MKSIAALILCLLGLPVSAGTIACSHAELCKLAAQIAAENHLKGFKTQSVINVTGDPHEYEPGTAEIKSLLNAPLLLTGPAELNPWIKKIIYQRSKNPSLKTISLLFEKNDLEGYSKASAETLSHFWLYPKIYCAFKERLEKELKNYGHSVVSKKCDSSTVEKELALSLSQIKMPIILTHDALLPLLSSLAPGKVIIAIKGSGHHEETGTKAIKNMYKALEAPAAVWVVENNIHVPENILNKIRTSDIVIKLDTSSSDAASFSTLKELSEKLKAVGGKK